MKRWDGWVLKPEYEDLYEEFYLVFGDGGCTCFKNPPCSYCTAEGNPANLLETDEAWEHPLKNAVRRVVEDS